MTRKIPAPILISVYNVESGSNWSAVEGSVWKMISERKNI